MDLARGTGEDNIGTTRSSVGSTHLPTSVPKFDSNIDVDVSETVNVCEAAYKSYDYDNEFLSLGGLWPIPNNHYLRAVTTLN